MKLEQIELVSPAGLKLEVTNYGATLTRLQVPDKNGKLTDVLIGLPSAKDYQTEAYQKYNYCLGATIGRFAGRISKGGFFIKDDFFEIANQNGVQLHGGENSLDKQLWTVEEVVKDDSPYVLLSFKSKAGENGYPGNATFFAKYQLWNTTLMIRYTATTDAPTVINLTNHAYFNLDGEGSTLGNELCINAQQYLEVDERLVPTGRLLDVVDTPYDYRRQTPLHFDEHNGFDTPFVLNNGDTKATLYSQYSGIKMKVTTNQPAVVIFTPHDFGGLKIRDNEKYDDFPAICFECQNYPDAPNQPHFPSALLQPGNTYLNEIGYQFSVE